MSINNWQNVIATRLIERDTFEKQFDTLLESCKFLVI